MSTHSPSTVANTSTPTRTQIREPYPMSKLSLLKPRQNSFPAPTDPPQRAGGMTNPPGEPRTSPQARGSGAGLRCRRSAPAARTGLAAASSIAHRRFARYRRWQRHLSTPAALPSLRRPLAPSSQGAQAPPSRLASRTATAGPLATACRRPRPAGVRGAPGGRSPADF